MVGVTGVPNLGFPFVAMVMRLLAWSHVLSVVSLLSEA